MNKSNGFGSTEESQVIWFKWEFLRRNEDYQRDFVEYERRFGSWFKKNGSFGSHPKKMYSPEAWSFLESEIAPAIHAISKRWGIGEPVNPRLDFDPRGVRSSGENGTAILVFVSTNDQDLQDREALDPELPPAVRNRIDKAWKGWDEFFVPNPSTRDVENYRFIRTTIDITKPIQDTFADLERTIEVRRQLYRARINPLPDHRRKRRLRLDQYPIYLRVWDLRRRQNLSFEQIAREVFPVKWRIQADSVLR